MRQYFENAKISAVRSLADDLFSARSNMVNYVYNLVSLCLLFSVLSIIHTVIIISVMFILTYSNTNGIALEAQWIPRSLNGKADLLRRFIDENDSPVNPYVFRVVEAKWGPRTNLNRFTSYYRAFSFRVLTPSLLLLVVGVSDAFVRD